MSASMDNRSVLETMLNELNQLVDGLNDEIDDQISRLFAIQ
jgi:hypothetical protein